MFTADSDGYSSYLHRRFAWPRIRLPLAGMAAFATLVVTLVGCLR